MDSATRVKRSVKTGARFITDRIIYTIVLWLVVDQDCGDHSDPHTGELRRDRILRRRIWEPSSRLKYFIRARIGSNAISEWHRGTELKYKRKR
jgi:hypothetical protein